jgi:Fe-S oxidoreductase
MSKFDYAGYFGAITPLADALREHPTRFWEPTPERLAQPHEYVLYLGCNVLRTVHLAEAIVAVLEALGVDFIALGGPANCCGIVHHRNGDEATARRLTGNSLAKLSAPRPKEVLVYCPSCHSHLDETLPGDLAFDVPYRHVTDFIAERLGQLRFRRPVQRRIALHAHEGFRQQVIDSRHTRTILQAIPGLDVVDLPAHEAWGRACIPQTIAELGAGRFDAMVASMFDAAREQGCDGIAAVYHSCYRELLAYESRHGLELLNYVELLADALGLGPFEPRYKALKQEQDPAAAYERLASRAALRGANLPRLRASLQAHFAPAGPPQDDPPA